MGVPTNVRRVQQEVAEFGVKGFTKYPHLYLRKFSKMGEHKIASANGLTLWMTVQEGKKRVFTLSGHHAKQGKDVEDFLKSCLTAEKISKFFSTSTRF